MTQLLCRLNLTLKLIFIPSERHKTFGVNKDSL